MLSAPLMLCRSAYCFRCQVRVRVIDSCHINPLSAAMPAALLCSRRSIGGTCKASSAQGWQRIRSAARTVTPPLHQCHFLHFVLCTCRNFTDTALGIALVILNSVVDLVSFSSILYSIYPPLFAALLAYSIGGTVASVWLGKVRNVPAGTGNRPAALTACTTAPTSVAARFGLEG
jgi:hypothetical protein